MKAGLRSRRLRRRMICVAVKAAWVDEKRWRGVISESRIPRARKEAVLMEKTVAADPTIMGRVVLREGRWNWTFQPEAVSFSARRVCWWSFLSRHRGWKDMVEVSGRGSIRKGKYQEGVGRVVA